MPKLIKYALSFYFYLFACGGWGWGVRACVCSCHVKQLCCEDYVDDDGPNDWEKKKKEKLFFPSFMFELNHFRFFYYSSNFPRGMLLEERERERESKKKRIKNFAFERGRGTFFKKKEKKKNK